MLGNKLNDCIYFYFIILESTSSNADCNDAGKQTPAEFSEVNDPAFIEPKPGTKPSETIKIRDINRDKLESSKVKGTADLVTTKRPKDLQAASSSGQSVYKSLNKAKLLQKQVPGRGGFCYTSTNTYLIDTFVVQLVGVSGEFGRAVVCSYFCER